MEAFEIESLLNDGILQSFFQNFRTIIPGVVVSATGNIATVQVAIQDLDASGNPVPGQVNLFSVPIMGTGGSSNYLSCQVAPGDYGLILVCDRDVTIFKQAQASAPAASFGVSNLQYSVFIPGLFLPAFNGVKIASNTEVLISVGGCSVDLTPTSITMGDGTASIVIQGGNISVTGNLIINEDVTFGTGGNVTGDLTIAGSVSATEDITSGSISLQTHIHGGVQTGGGHTGEPI